MTTARSSHAAIAVAVLGLLCSLLVAPAAAQEPTVRVAAPGGSPGGAGTVESPWNLEHGLRNVQPGEQLLLRGGEYHEDVRNIPYRARAGTPSTPVLVAAWPGERPIIRSQWNLRDTSWWTFRGITVRWPAAGRPVDAGEPLVKLMGGTGWTFQDNDVAGAIGYAGVYIGQSTETGTPRGWALLDNCIWDTRDSGRPGNTDHNLYLQNGVQGGEGLIQGNLLFRAPHGTNIKLGSGSGSSSPSASNVVIRYNTLYDAAQNLLAEHDVRDVLIERNVIGRITDRPGELGNLRGNGNSTGSVRARDNVAWGAARFIANTIEGQTTASAQGIVDAGGNRFPREPGFDGVNGCSQFRPTDGGAIAYGHRARAERIAGEGRTATAVALSRSARPAGASAGTALLATAGSYPDALAGAPLAQKLDAPLLLTGGDRLDPLVAGELDRLGVREVVVLGGRNAVSEQVLKDAQARPGVQTVRRIAGDDRFLTAGAIAREVGGDEVYVVEGASADPDRGWPDAVSVSGLAARQQRPILLVTTSSLPEGTRAAMRELDVADATIVGGTLAVSEDVERQVREIVGPEGSVERVAGDSRYATSLAVAEIALADGASGTDVYVATGANWPDALAAGPAAAARGGLLVLAPGSSPEAAGAVARFLERVVPAGSVPRIVGGTGAISAPVEDRLAAAVPAR